MWGRSLGKQLNLYGNPSVLNIPRCTHDIPHTPHGIPQCTEHPSLYSWYPHIHHGIPAVLMVSLIVLSTPWCTHDTSQCTEHPRYTQWYPPCVLNIPRCTAQTLCRVITKLNEKRVVVFTFNYYKYFKLRKYFENAFTSLACNRQVCSLQFSFSLISNIKETSLLLVFLSPRTCSETASSVYLVNMSQVVIQMRF